MLYIKECSAWGGQRCWIPAARVTGSCEQPDVGTGKQTSSLKEQYVLLTLSHLSKPNSLFCSFVLFGGGGMFYWLVFGLEIFLVWFGFGGTGNLNPSLGQAFCHCATS